MADGFKQGAQVPDGMFEHGEAMGFAKGGKVVAKGMPASKGFKPTIKQQKAGMTGEDRRESSSVNDEKLGGKSKLMPGYAKGGYVKTKMRKGGTCYMKGGVAYKNVGGQMKRMPAREYAAMGGVMKKAKGGKVNAGPSGAKTDPANRRRVTGASPGEGDAVPAQGKGAKNVGKGGTTGGTVGPRSKRGAGQIPDGNAGGGSKYAKGGSVKSGGKVNKYRTNDPGGYKGAMKNRGKGVV